LSRKALRLYEARGILPTVSLQGLPGVRVVRASSAFGFSMINVIFEDDVDLCFARSRVLERLNLLAKSLPVGVTPTLGRRDEHWGTSSGYGP
jgi:Cu/Ag efflux pump CusA